MNLLIFFSRQDFDPISHPSDAYTNWLYIQTLDFVLLVVTLRTPYAIRGYLKMWVLETGGRF